MTKKLDYFLPFNDLIQYVPQNLRNTAITGLIGNLFNRFMTRDESIPLYGYIGAKPSLLDDNTPAVPQASVERDINAVIPVLNWRQGAVRYCYTAQDLLNKAKVLGIPSSDLNWLYTQANNYAPPIDIDKFTRYYNYFWYAKAIPNVPSLSWNTELLPEYYTISRPANSDLDKMNVVTATTSSITLTGTGFLDQEFLIEFTSATSFTMTALAPLPAGYSGSVQSFSLTPLPVAPSASPIVDSFDFTVTGPASVTLVSFKIQRDPRYDEFGVLVENGSFATGDEFTLDTVFLSQNFTTTFTGSAGFKGKIVDVVSLNEYQTIGGVQVSEGQRVLVKDNSAAENGIWIVRPQGWIRADDYKGSTIVAGSRVWVSSGVHYRSLFTSVVGGWALTATNVDSNTNEWQEGNFWVHTSELERLNLTRTQVVQATRPIIEFQTGLELNSHFDSSGPSAGPSGYYQQTKSEFNQLPLFNLYRYDGTHAGKASAIFYYEEDETADLDIALQKRVKKSQSDSADYVFNHGLIDDDGDQLFYKRNGNLKSIWHPGYLNTVIAGSEFVGKQKGKIDELTVNFGASIQTWTITAVSLTQFQLVGSIAGVQPQLLTVGLEYAINDFSITINNGTIPFAIGDSFSFSISAGSVASPIVFSGDEKGTLTGLSIVDSSQQQIWILTATSSTTFEVRSSKYGVVGEATVGVLYANTDVSFTISAGTLPYDVDDVFLFRIGNIDTPRYMTRNADAELVDFYGGPAADVNGDGAYQVPRSLSYNPFNDSRGEVLEGTLFSHFQSILNNQLESLPIDAAFGGSIKGWSEQHSLLASLLMQKDLTPISMIDVAQRQYETALNAIVDLFNTNIVQYMVSNGVVNPANPNPIEYTAKLSSLVDYLISLRANDHLVRVVLSDTTSPVSGFPPTLPQLGIRGLSRPGIVFDNQLGLTLIQHHDGHLSPLFVDDLNFRTKLLNEEGSIEVQTTNGIKTAVQSMTTTEPIDKFKGALWIRPTGSAGSEILAFDVTFDVDPSTLNYGLGAGQIIPTVGMTWYAQSTNTLREWDGSTWVVITPTSQAWKVLSFNTLLNEVIIEIERRLFAGINSTARLVDFAPLMSVPGFRTQLERELFSYSAIQGVDPMASDYSATNAFTWNYSSANIVNFAPLASASVPARWFNILTSHQTTVAGVLTTDRPERQPWRLFGFATMEDWWASLTPIQQNDYLPPGGYEEELISTDFIGTVRVVQTANAPTFPSGLQVIDSVSLNAGDLVLIQNDPNPINNGLWTVSAAAWTRPVSSGVAGTFVRVAEGLNFSNTTWKLMQDVPTVGLDPIEFAQVRLWGSQLWLDLQAARPTLKLSVDINRDVLLPPYVSASSPLSSFALTTVIPPGITLPYSFGQGSAVETLWTKTLDYGYTLARALFRYDPLMFLGFCWGYNWVDVDTLVFDAYDVNFPGHRRFKLHGEAITSRSRELTGSRAAISISAITSTSSTVRIKYDAYSTQSGNRLQSFSIRTSMLEEPVGYVFEGTAPATVSNLTTAIVGLAIEDFGKTFRIGDEFVITTTDSWATYNIDFIPAQTHKFMGFGQVFTQALRELSIDSNAAFAIQAYRNWDVDMGYRVGGLVSTDDLKIRTDNDTLSGSSYELILKKNEIAKDIWAHALRITVSQFGEVKDLGEPGFAPVSDGSDWIFRIEGYNPRYTNISYYTYSTSSNLITFQALSGETTELIWNQPTIVTGTANTFLPLTITGIQNVVNFLFGYSNWLKDQGWEFNVIGASKDDGAVNVDAETGRTRTWQLEIEKIIDRCYRGIRAGEGIIANPFQDRIWVRQDTGLLSQFSDSQWFDVTANAAVYDVVGVNMKATDLFVNRQNQISEISAAAPMYSVHAQIDDYEHLIVFDKFVEDSIANGILYEPFSGARVVTYKFNGRRQAGSTFRPEFGGYYISNGEVRQNLQTSTDNVAAFYDADKVFENDLSTRHAMALLGFSKKDYFSNLDITDKSQFNFWRGLVQSKGTNLSISAYLNNNRFEDAKIDEYWAYKLAEYGDARQKSFPEVKLTVNDTLQQFAQLQFDSLAPIQNFTQIDSTDESRWFNLDDIADVAASGVSFLAEEVGRFISTATTLEPIRLPFVADKLILTNCTQLNATTIVPSSLGAISVIGYGAADRRYTPLKLIDYVEDQVVEEIPIWHPAAGKHTPVPMEDVNIISNINPAKYNYSTLIVGNASYDPLRPWGDNEVGRIWFNTTNLAYVPYYDSKVFPNRQERLSRWGALAEHARIDVYEWVKSTVPPAEYNELAQLQAGNADLDQSSKAAGEVAEQQLYSRTRKWNIRPIAWSRASVANAAAHPDFEYESNNPLHISTISIAETSRFTLSVGTFEDRGIEVGMRIGAWDNTPLAEKPLSEHNIIRFETSLQESMLGTPFETVQVSTSASTPLACDVSIESIEHTGIVGELMFTRIEPIDVRRVDPDGVALDAWDTNIQLQLTETDSGETEIISLGTVVGLTVSPGPVSFSSPGYRLHGATIVVYNGQRFEYTFERFGIKVIVTSTVSGQFSADSLAFAIENALVGVFARDSAVVTDIVSTSQTELDNGDTDASNDWRAWRVPTQADLTADAQSPNGVWKPYVGDFAEVDLSSPTFELLQEAIEAESDALTLKDGTVISKFNFTWSNWEPVVDWQHSFVQEVSGNAIIQHPDSNPPSSPVAFDLNITSVYVNGIARLRGTFAAVDDTLVISNVEEGSIVLVIIRAYEPTAQELAFNPDVEDDLTFQTQYKRDYDYVVLQQRDSEGSLTQSFYYFWVKNKSIAAVGKKFSIQSISQQLRDGPPNYITFQPTDAGILGSGTLADPYRYDAITISGLNYIVGQDDKYKLRLVRDFTLRDDPNGLTLKNVHTEWGLIRPGQRTRIPEKLWLKLVDSMCAEDVAGNQLPSLRRALYDERTGSRSSFGFGPEQVLAAPELLISSVAETIVNTQLTNTDLNPDSSGNYPPDFIEFLNPSQYFDRDDLASALFSSATTIRQTMTSIWTTAKPRQINEIFFAALNDILASNLELTDIFKTSRLSAYSIKVVPSAPGRISYD